MACIGVDQSNARVRQALSALILVPTPRPQRSAPPNTPPNLGLGLYLLVLIGADRWGVGSTRSSR